MGNKTPAPEKQVEQKPDDVVINPVQKDESPPEESYSLTRKVKKSKPNVSSKPRENQPKTPVEEQTPGINFELEDELPPSSIPEMNKSQKGNDEYDLERGLSIELISHQNIYKLSKTDSQKIPALISLKTLDSTSKNATETSEEKRPGIDLVCVIDKSGSMGGEKIELVIQTLNYMLQQLSEDDRISLCSFNSNGETISNLRRVTKDNVEIFKDLIKKKLRAGGGTNITSGMVRALDVLEKRKTKNSVTSIFLLTDGQDDSKGAENRVQQQLESRNLVDPFTIHTFGFGNDHDPQVMRDIAKLKDGNFYYVKDLTVVDECFVDALGGLMSVVGQNLRIEVRTVNKPPFGDLRISNTYGNLWKYDETTKTHNIALTQVISGVTKDFVFEINLPPIKKSLENDNKVHSLIDVKLTCEGAGEKKETVAKHGNLQVRFYNEDDEFPVPETVRHVSINYFRVKAAEAMGNALTLNNQGEYEEAKKELNSILSKILDSPFKDEEYLIPLINDLKDAIENCEPKRYDEVGRKMMMNRNYVHMEQQSNAEFAAYSNKVQVKMKTDSKQIKPRKKPADK